MRWAEHVACVGERKGACRVLVAKPDEKRPLGRPRHRRKNNFRMDLQEKGWGGAWTDLIWPRIGKGGRLLQTP